MCRTYHDALAEWCERNGARLPPSLSVLEDAVEDDPWGNPYLLVHDGTGSFRICSNGPDGEEGTGDDICYPEADR